MKVSKLLLVVTLMVLAWVSSASYAADYVCYARFIPNEGTMGTSGYNYATYYSGPNCTGLFNSSKYYCTNGSTNNLCASSSAYLRSSSQLLTEIDLLVEAAREGQRVFPSTTTCNSGGSTCGGYIGFYGN